MRAFFWVAVGYMLAVFTLRILAQFEFKAAKDNFRRPGAPDEVSATPYWSRSAHKQVFQEVAQSPQRDEAVVAIGGRLWALAVEQLASHADDLHWVSMLAEIVQAELKQEVQLVLFVFGRLVIAFVIMLVASWALRNAGQACATRQPERVRRIALWGRGLLSSRPLLGLATSSLIVTGAVLVVGIAAVPGGPASAMLTLSSHHTSMSTQLPHIHASAGSSSHNAEHHSRGALREPRRRRWHLGARGRRGRTAEQESSMAERLSARASAIVSRGAGVARRVSLHALSSLFTGAARAIRALATPLAGLALQWWLLALAVPTSIARDLLFDETGGTPHGLLPAAPRRALQWLRSLLERDIGPIHRLTSALYLLLASVPTAQLWMLWWRMRACGLPGDCTLQEKALSPVQKLCTLLWLRGCASATRCALPTQPKPRGERLDAKVGY